jgi:hypothetical protein
MMYLFSDMVIIDFLRFNFTAAKKKENIYSNKSQKRLSLYKIDDFLFLLFPLPKSLQYSLK